MAVGLRVTWCVGCVLGMGVGWGGPRYWGLGCGVIVAKRHLFFDSTPVGRGVVDAALCGRSVFCLFFVCFLCLGGAPKGIWRGPVPLPNGQGVEQELSW